MLLDLVFTIVEFILSSRLFVSFACLVIASSIGDGFVLKSVNDYVRSFHDVKCS